MNIDQAFRHIDDYAAGTLDRQLRDRIDQLAARHPELRAELDAAMQLRVDVAALPRTLMPARDLWPGVASRLYPHTGDSVVVSGDFGGPTAPEPGAPQSAVPDAPDVVHMAGLNWQRIGGLAAAAMLLVVASSGITAYVIRSAETVDSKPAVQAPANIRTVAWDQFRAVENSYNEVTSELLMVLENRRAQMPVETVEIFDAKLADLTLALTQLNEAIDSMRSALERDPSNAGLANKLTSTYRKRVTLLQGMTRL